jgi:hypothetical protein
LYVRAIQRNPFLLGAIGSWDVLKFVAHRIAFVSLLGRLNAPQEEYVAALRALHFDPLNRPPLAQVVVVGDNARARFK